VKPGSAHCAAAHFSGNATTFRFPENANRWHFFCEGYPPVQVQEGEMNWKRVKGQFLDVADRSQEGLWSAEKEDWIEISFLCVLAIVSIVAVGMLMM